VDIETKTKEMIWHFRSKTNHKAVLFPIEEVTHQTQEELERMQSIWPQIKTELDNFAHDYVRKAAFRSV
jgi:hypothetical protein